MNPEPALRLCGAVALAGVIAVGLPYRLRAQRVGGKVSRRAEGLGPMIALRAVAALWALGFVLWLVNPERMRWTEVALPVAVRVVGAALLVAAVPLYAWVFHHLGLNVTDTVVTRRDATLVRSGPYRFVRHPLYAFGALVLAGWALLTANLFVAAAGTVAAALLARRTRIEEAHLIERFGDQYRAYMATTGGFVPRPRRG